MRNLMDNPVVLVVLLGFLVLAVLGVLLLVWAVRRGVSSGIRDADRRRERDRGPSGA